MTFHVGQKVVCVDNGIHPEESFKTWSPCGDRPVLGETYTVMAVGFYHNIETVLLREIQNGAHGGRYKASRFRPLTDQKKSVSFTMGADPDSERWDNRRKVVEPVNALINASNAVSDRFDRRAVQVQETSAHD